MRKIFHTFLLLYIINLFCIDCNFELLDITHCTFNLENEYDKYIFQLQHTTPYVSSIPLQNLEDFRRITKEVKTWKVENYPFECLQYVLYLIHHENSQALKHIEFKLIDPQYKVPENINLILMQYDLTDIYGNIREPIINLLHSIDH